MIKEITVQISVKFTNIENKVIQRFTILGGKRNWRYLLDSRFYTKKIFDNEIKEKSLPIKSNNHIFESKIENENYIEITSIVQDEIFDNNLLIDYYFTVHDFIPTTFGCEYCNFNYNDDFNKIMVNCDFFRKPTKRRKGSCKYFNQKKLFKT